jgi:hypothetical protein
MLKVFVIIWTVVIIIICYIVPAKAIDFSIGVATGYNQGSLGIGYNIPNLGTAKDTAYPISLIGRVIYPMKYVNPTIELTYKQARYDVNTSVANMHLEPLEFSARAGLIKEIYGFELLGFVGYTHNEYNLYVVQNMGNGKWFAHGQETGLTGGNIFDTVSFRFGIAKYYKHIGVEMGVEYYPQSRKIDRCMTFDTNNIEPYAALQVRF